jgi:membrane protein YdbS with pleckstrin-like domain
VTIDTTPSEPAPETAWRQLDPESVKVGRLGGFIAAAIVGSVSLLGCAIMWLTEPASAWLALSLAGGAVVFTCFVAWLAWVMPERRFRYTRYRLDHLGLLVHRGRLFHSELGMLRSRIQYSDVTQGPVQRAFGLATLSIHTAGAQHGEISLSGIRIDEARRLRTELTGWQSDDVV